MPNSFKFDSNLLLLAQTHQILVFKMSEMIQNFDFKWISGHLVALTQNCHLNFNQAYCGKWKQVGKESSQLSSKVEKGHEGGGCRSLDRKWIQSVI